MYSMRANNVRGEFEPKDSRIKKRTGAEGVLGEKRCRSYKEWIRCDKNKDFFIRYKLTPSNRQDKAKLGYGLSRMKWSIYITYYVYFIPQKMKQRPITKPPLNISHISLPTVMVEGKSGRCKTLNYKVGKTGVKNYSKKCFVVVFHLHHMSVKGKRDSISPGQK